MKKLILMSVMLFCVGSIQAQEAKEIYFAGGYHYQYSQPLPNGEKDGKQIYVPYFVNKGQFNDRGRITLDEKNNTFSVIWDSGDNWTSDIIKKEVVEDVTTFTGQWRDSFFEGQLVITDLNVYGCSTTVQSKRVIDEKYGINDWKHRYYFGTSGRCLVEQSETSKKLIEEAKDEEISKEEFEKLENKMDTVKEDVLDIGKEKKFIPVEKMPEFPGGTQAFMSYLSNNLIYPELAKESGIQGQVYVNFTIDSIGNVSNIKIIRGIGGGCDEETIRLFESMPKWSPGMQEGKAVSVSYNTSIKFSLK